MNTENLILLAVTLLILGEVTYLLAKLPKTSIKARDRAILIDTSVLMDGRITSIAATGFIGGTLVVPRSVIGELQLLADGSDSDKRSRARYGLDVVAELQKLDHVEVEILQDGSRANEGVDERLLTLAKQHHAVICTLDFNLNKVAAVESIQVLNINELAQGIRMSHLPGDQTVIELVQKGQDSHQAVGYLPDGTMVVVEQSSAYLGKTVHIEVIRSLQTAAGKMMFARRIDTTPSKKSAIQPQPTGRAPAREPRKQPQAQESAPQKPAARRPYRQSSDAPRQPAERPVQSVDTKPVQVRPTPSRTPSAPVEVPAAAKPAHQQPRRRNNRRPDREAALIALVNNQD